MGTGRQGESGGKEGARGQGEEASGGERGGGADGRARQGRYLVSPPDFSVLGLKIAGHHRLFCMHVCLFMLARMKLCMHVFVCTLTMFVDWRGNNTSGRGGL